jgi:DNA replication protein DnaC
MDLAVVITGYHDYGKRLKISKANGTYTSWLAQLAKIDLLILDDWGWVSPDSERRQD